MNKQRKTSHILNVFQYDVDGHVVLPASLTLTVAPASNDNSGKVGTTARVRSYVTGLSYLTGNQSISVSGDATGSGTTSIALTLANTTVTPGTYGSTTLVPVVTVDSKGRITSVTTAAISGSLTFTGDITGTGTTGTSTAMTLAASGVTAGTYTKVTVDTKGRVTVGASATTSDISEGTNLYYTDARVLTYLTANTYATQSYVGTQIANLVASAPATLNTLNELATALGNDPNFATTVSTSIGTKVPQTRTITINGTALDLSADRTFTIAAGVTSFNTRQGAITLSSSDVTGALGFTPYNSTNPSGYITSSALSSYVPTSGYSFGTAFTLGTMYVGTGAQATVSSLLGVYSNGYAYIFGAAAVQSFLGLGSLAYSSATIPTNNNQLTNGAGYITSSGSISGNAATATSAGTVTGSSTVNGYLTLATNWGVSPYTSALTIIGTHPSMTFRGSNGDTHYLIHMDSAGDIQYYFGPGYTTNNWTRRYEFSKGGNFTVVTGTISATNFSGSSSGTNTGDQTNISGNAATATTASTANAVAWGNVSSKPSHIMYYQSFTLDANTMDVNATGFTYAVNAPFTGPIVRFSAGGAYDLWLNATYGGGGNSIAYRTRNGDSATLNPWREIIHTGNIASQKVDGSLKFWAASHPNDYYLVNNWTGTYWRITSNHPSGVQVAYADSAGSAPANGGNSSTVGGYSVSTGGSANTIPTRNGSGYLSPENWIQLNGHYGLYSGTNGAHFYPNNSSYGSWKSLGDRNGWRGIHFGEGTGMTLMMNETEFGFHREAHGWYARFTNGRYYGTSDNTVSISSATGGAYTWTGINYFETNNGGSAVNNSNSAKLQAYSTGNNTAFMSFHRGGYYAVNFGLDNDNWMRIGGWSAAANRWQLNTVSGDMVVNGDVTAFSDARVKENIVTVDNALEKVLALRGVFYTRSDQEDKKRKIGVIAQETLLILPEVVNTDPSGMYNVSYGNLAGLFIEAFKEQQKEIEELKTLIYGITR